MPYLKSFDATGLGSVQFYLYDDKFELVRRVLLGKDLMEQLKSGARFVDSSDQVTEILDPELMEFYLADVKAHAKGLEESIIKEK